MSSPLAVFLNDHFSSKIGFYLSSACLALGSMVFFLIDAHKASKSRHKNDSHNYSLEKDRNTFTQDTHHSHHPHHSHHHRQNLLTGGNINSHGVTNDALLNGINLLSMNDINSIYHAHNPLFRRSSSSSPMQNIGTSCRPIDGIMSTQARILHNYLRSLTHDTSRSLGASLEPSSNNSTLNNASLGKVSPCRLNNLSNSTLCTHNIHAGNSGGGVGNIGSGGYKISGARSSRSNSLDPALCELTCISEEVNFLDDLNDMWDTDSTTADAGTMSIVNCKNKKSGTMNNCSSKPAAVGNAVEAVYANSSTSTAAVAGTTADIVKSRENDDDSAKDCHKSEYEKMRSDKKRESMRDDDCSGKVYDGEDEASHFLMVSTS